MTISRKMMVALAGVATFAGAAMVQSTAATAADTAAEAIAERQALLKSMGDSMRPLSGIARGRVDADKAVMTRHANNVAAKARGLAASFNKDTRSSGIASDALPAIWTSKADFNRKSAALVTASGRLQAAANAGDVASFRTALGAVGQTCKECHDSYRAK